MSTQNVSIGDRHHNRRPVGDSLGGVALDRASTERS